MFIIIAHYSFREKYPLHQTNEMLYNVNTEIINNLSLYKENDKGAFVHQASSVSAYWSR